MPNKSETPADAEGVGQPKREASLAAPNGYAADEYEVVIQGCDCDGFRRGNGIWFDSQDLREFESTKCPACHKPFPREKRKRHTEEVSRDAGRKDANAK